MNKQQRTKAGRTLAATVFSEVRFEDKLRSMVEDTNLTKEEYREVMASFLDEFGKIANQEFKELKKEQKL